MFLARPRRKQGTATKLGIYSTYSPRCSIHFLVHCFLFYSSHSIKIRNLSVQLGLRGKNDVLVRRKMVAFQLSSKPKKQEVIWRGQIRRLGWVIKTLEARETTFFGLKEPGEPGQCRARTRHPWWISRGLFPWKCSSIVKGEMSNTPLW